MFPTAQRPAPPKRPSIGFTLEGVPICGEPRRDIHKSKRRDDSVVRRWPSAHAAHDEAPPLLDGEARPVAVERAEDKSALQQRAFPAVAGSTAARRKGDEPPRKELTPEPIERLIAAEQPRSEAPSASAQAPRWEAVPAGEAGRAGSPARGASRCASARGASSTFSLSRPMVMSTVRVAISAESLQTWMSSSARLTTWPARLNSQARAVVRGGHVFFGTIGQQATEGRLQVGLRGPAPVTGGQREQDDCTHAHVSTSHTGRASHGATCSVAAVSTARAVQSVNGQGQAKSSGPRSQVLIIVDSPGSLPQTASALSWASAQSSTYSALRAALSASRKGRSVSHSS